MFKFLFNAGLMGAILSGISALRQTVRGPRDWRLYLIWGGWLLSLALVIANAVIESRDDEQDELDW